MFQGMYGHGWGMGWGWMSLIILIFVIWLIFNMLNRNNQLPKNEKTPLDILKERYAKGEIDKQEFEEMKKNL